MSRLSYLTRSSRFSWPYAFNVSRVANKCERKMKRQFISDYKWRRRNLSSAKLISHDARVLRRLLDLCDARIKIRSKGYMVIGGLMMTIVLLSHAFYESISWKCEGRCRLRKFSCEEILKYVHDLFTKNFNNIEIYYNHFSLSPWFSLLFELRIQIEKLG